MNEHLKLVEQWDKTFPISNKVHHHKATFHNRYGITLAADLYAPKDINGTLPAIAVCGPFGAVKEQAAGTVCTGNGGKRIFFNRFRIRPSPEKAAALPDIWLHRTSIQRTSQAAVDFLSVQENVNPEKIGLIGICGWGGMALNAGRNQRARVKATATMTMYDMSRVNANGYFDAEDSEAARYEKKKTWNAQRSIDYKNGEYARGGGVMDPLAGNWTAPFFVKDYYDYYKTSRGYHERSLNSNDGWNITGTMSFMNMPILQYASEIRSAVLIVHGEKAHSCDFSKDAFAKLKGNNKELLLIPNAVHTDLYDRTDIIPFDTLTTFFQKWL